MCRDYRVKICDFILGSVKKISNFFLLIVDKLRINKEPTEEEAYRCPCCGYAPCDCDDH